MEIILKGIGKLDDLQTLRALAIIDKEVNKAWTKEIPSNGNQKKFEKGQEKFFDYLLMRV